MEPCFSSKANTPILVHVRANAERYLYNMPNRSSCFVAAPSVDGVGAPRSRLGADQSIF